MAKTSFGKTAELVTDFDPSLPPSFGDHDQLVQVFLNLVKNSVSAIPDDGGRVAVKTTYRHDVQLNGRDRGHIPLQVTVRDNGIGIPEEIRRYIFDPFVTSSSGGTGLGLALVAKVIAEHGGSIDYHSSETGTEFCFRLPIMEEHSAVGAQTMK